MLIRERLLLLILLGVARCQLGNDSSILQIFDTFLQQDEVSLPNLTIEDVSHQLIPSSTNTTISTNSPIVIQVQDLQVGLASDTVSPKEEAAEISPASSMQLVEQQLYQEYQEPVGQQLQEEEPQRRSFEVQPLGQVAADQQAAILPSPVPANTISQRLNFSGPGSQLLPTTSAFITTGSVADIYGNVNFPTLYRSGTTQSQFQIKDESGSMLSVGGPDVACKPLLLGNACLYQLLQSITFFYNALKKTGLMDVVCGFSPLTILAPTDASFAKLAQELDMIAEDFLAPQNLQVLGQIMQLHLFPDVELSPAEIVERSSVVPEVQTSFLGQFVYSTTDSGNVYFRPPLRTSPTTTAMLSLSGQAIYLQEDCVVDYLYVLQNVLMPDFASIEPPLGG